ncbi:MAG: DUF3302 domain-containing protein [Colwellia sp.]|nr:DUF3302 domain-containing protein [Colwellia sp.]
MLEYVALGILVFAAITVFYGIIVIHDIPYEIAKKRNHPQQDALHVAGWVSLFTLHVLWPFLWIWAMLYREDRGWGFSHQNQAGSKQRDHDITPQQFAELTKRIEILEQQLVPSVNNAESEKTGAN